MRPVKYSKKMITELFDKRKVMTKAELLGALGCSPMTLWRILREQGYLSSYNCNSKYYTLAAIPQFDSHGLWAYKHARFSQQRTLIQTVISLIHNSTSGLDSIELQETLHVNTMPLITNLFQQEKLFREKVRGRFVYLSTDKKNREVQLEKRYSEPDPVKPYKLPEPERIIAVLVELIQEVKRNPKEVTRRLKLKGITIALPEVEAIFHHYQLTGKKND